MSISSLVRIIIGIFRLIIPPAGPVDDFEYPNYTDNFGRSYRESVGRWKYTAAIGYQNIDHISKSQVVEIWWYKNVEGLEHEYIIVACRRAGEVDVYLRLERRPLNTSSDLVIPARALPQEMIAKFNKAEYAAFQANVATERKFVRNSFGAPLQRPIPSSKGRLPFVDSVTRIYGARSFLGEEAVLVAHYDNFQKPFHVRDLAFLTDRISAHPLNHPSLVQQSYWYAQILIKLVLTIYKPTLSGPSLLSAAGTHTVAKRLMTPVIVVSKDCQGSTMEDIKTAFESALEVHNAQVRKRYYERIGRQLELEQQLQEETKKRMELEDQLARIQGIPQAIK